ncbi:MAG: ATP-grasp domain-containing protein [Balneolaceae bacterium]
MKKSLRDVQSVLIIGTENIIVLPVARSLGRLMPQAKLFTQSPISNRRPAWAASKFIDDCHYFYTKGDSNVLQELLTCIKSTNADLVLPADENYVRFMAKYKHIIKKHVFVPPLPSPQQFDQLVPKDKMNEFLKKNHLPHPNNYRLDDPKLHNWDIASAPLFLKSVRGSSGTGMQKIHDLDELYKISVNLNPNNFFIQEEIKGEIIDCSFLAIDGEIKAYSIQKNLTKNGYNFSTSMEFVRHDQVYNTTREVVERSGYSGLANLDFYIDKNDGQPKLIDFNARFWVSVLGSKAAGIDFAELYCLAALGHPIKKTNYEQCIYLMGKSAIEHHKKQLVNPFLWNSPKRIYTDLWDRVTDPEPELIRFMGRKS